MLASSIRLLACRGMAPSRHVLGFLLGLFVIAAGMTCLGTIANPYATALGAPESGPTRINIAQTVNGLGWIFGPIVGGHFVFSGGDRANANAGLTAPYLAIGIFVALLRFTAFYYNSALKYGGHLGVINYEEYAIQEHSVVLDLERGQLSDG